MKQASLTDSHRLMLRERETAEAYDREKKQMERRHAIRVNQLVQETMTARYLLQIRCLVQCFPIIVTPILKSYGGRDEREALRCRSSQWFSVRSTGVM